MRNARPMSSGAGANRKMLYKATSQFYNNAAAPAAISESPAETILPRLEHVRETGPGCWVVRCPSHKDKNPSLSIKACSDGTLLLHCFAGCDAADIVAAMSLELRDLFPSTDNHRTQPKSNFERKRYGQALDALRALSRESLIILIACEQVVAGHALTAEDLERLRVAEHRIRAAREVVL